MADKHSAQSAPFTPRRDAAVVRYQIRDVERAVVFYTEQLGFEVKQRAGNVFATIARGDLLLLLSGPESSGSRPLSDGRTQKPGGDNRIVLYVDDIDATVAKLRATGTSFRNHIEQGPGGKQIQLEDPDGNAIELHEAPRK